MRKIVRQQNYLKELIETQGNRFLTRQALKCLVRSALEPLLDAPESGVVLYRIENKDGLQGLLKRLEYSEVQSISYADDSKNLLEKGCYKVYEVAERSGFSDVKYFMKIFREETGLSPTEWSNKHNN